MRVVICMSSKPLCRYLRSVLRAEHEVVLACTIEELTELLDARPMDLLLLSESFLRILEENDDSWGYLPPTIVLGPAEAEAACRALEAGADDYVGMPLHPRELLLRVRAVLRRTSTATPPWERAVPHTSPVLRYPGVTLDLLACELRVDDRSVHTTPIEWRMLVQLASLPGRLVTCENVLRAVWGEDFVDCHDYVRVYIARLRRLLSPYGHYIQTRHGLGYQWTAERLQMPAADVVTEEVLQ